MDALNNVFDVKVGNSQVRKIFLGSNLIWDLVKPVVPSNKILYTSSDGNIVTPYKTNAFGANIVSNTYNNGRGIMVFDDKVTTIGYFAFSSCSTLTSITIPNSVTTIGNYAFCWCSSLTSVNIPDNVTTIGNSAFSNCKSLTNITIPNRVTTIEQEAFRYCSSLTSVTIGNNVTKIGLWVFTGCSSMTEFIGKFAEDNGRILVVDGILKAFAPVGITEYNIPDSVTIIGDESFESYNSLKSVTIPNSVTSIGMSAFYGCAGLTSVYCKATTPPSLGHDDVFDNNGSGRKIYVPTESVDTYKSETHWNEYANQIVEYDFNA